MKKLFLMLGICSFLHCFELDKPLEDYKISFVLPINVASEEHFHLAVTIPKDYKSVQDPSTWDKAPSIEFIPRSEEIQNYSEIVTVMTHRGQRISASRFTEALKQAISSQANFSVLLDEKKNKKDYQETALILKYHYQGRDEVLGMRYLSGPYDCAGVQYTIRLSQNMDEKLAAEKINHFFNQNVTVIQKS